MSRKTEVTPSFQVETGPNGWAFVGAGFLFGTALVILALAIFQISLYLGWAAVILAGGSSVTCICFGVARVVEARGWARAVEKKADGYYVATVRAARLEPPKEPR